MRQPTVYRVREPAQRVAILCLLLQSFVQEAFPVRGVEVQGLASALQLRHQDHPQHLAQRQHPD